MVDHVILRLCGNFCPQYQELTFSQGEGHDVNIAYGKKISVNGAFTLQRSVQWYYLAVTFTRIEYHCSTLAKVMMIAEVWVKSDKLTYFSSSSLNMAFVLACSLSMIW